jgi:hypothetical protein
MSVTISGRNIGIVVQKDAGTVHTTTIHLIPIEYAFGVLTLIGVLLWIAVRRRNRSE